MRKKRPGAVLSGCHFNPAERMLSVKSKVPDKKYLPASEALAEVGRWQALHFYMVLPLNARIFFFVFFFVSLLGF